MSQNSVENVEKLLNVKNAFIAGMILGWAARLRDPSKLKDVIKDMNEFSKKLAVDAGVTLFEKKDSKI